MYFQRVRKISRGSCSSTTAQMGIQRCVEAIMEDLKNIQHLHRDQVLILIGRTDTLAQIKSILCQKVKITIDKTEEVVTESCGGHQKNKNPFSRDSSFLAVSLIQTNCCQFVLNINTKYQIYRRLLSNLHIFLESSGKTWTKST